MSEPFKFTAPGYYVTADGRKAHVSENVTKSYLAGVIFDADGGCAFASWDLDGKATPYLPVRDLTGPWVDPPKWEKIEVWAVVYPGGYPGGVYKEKSDAELLAGKNARIVRLTEPDDELLKAAEEIVASIPSVLVSLSEMIGDAYTPVKTSCLDALCAAVKNGRAG